VVYTLKCNITAEVNHLSEGLKIALQEDREKNSTSLGRSALWKGESKATSLPPHLTVQFVRFFWKTNVSAADGTQGAAHHTRTCTCTPDSHSPFDSHSLSLCIPGGVPAGCERELLSFG